MSRITVICPSCIGLGRIMREGVLHDCIRCQGEGRVLGIERLNINGQVIGYEPDPEV